MSVYTRDNLCVLNFISNVDYVCMTWGDRQQTPNFSLARGIPRSEDSIKVTTNY